MSVLKSWLLCVSCAAILAACCESLCPNGKGKSCVRLAGCLLLLCAVVRPLPAFRGQGIAPERLFESSAMQVRSEALSQEQENLRSRLIAEELGAYILDKAKDLGMTCRVEVTLAGEGEEPLLPRSVTVEGTWSEEQRQALSEVIEEDLGVSAEQQHYERGEGT